MMLAFLLTWAVEQIAWVHADAGHKACYQAFDTKGLLSLLTAVVTVMVVVAVVFGECATTRRYTSM